MDIKKQLGAAVAAENFHVIADGAPINVSKLASDSLAEIQRLEELVAASPAHYVQACKARDHWAERVGKLLRERELSAEASATLREECLAAKRALERSELAFAMLTERAVRLERELDQARALPASIQESLNSGDGTYRP